jgi:hypothetical protein
MVAQKNVMKNLKSPTIGLSLLFIIKELVAKLTMGSMALFSNIFSLKNQP